MKIHSSQVPFGNACVRSLIREFAGFFSVMSDLSRVRLVGGLVGGCLLGTSLLAHNLDTRATSIHYADDFIQLMSQRASANQAPVQVGDEFWVLIKTTPGPGTTTGVGGYQSFYVPQWMQILDAAYVLPDPSDPRGFSEIPMKGQSPIAIGAGPIGAKSTPELIGYSLPGSNGMGITHSPVTAAGVHRGTIAGVYADTGIFYSTDTRTAFNTYGAATSGGSLPMRNNSGDTVGEWDAVNVLDPTVLGVMTLWDSYQLRAYGRADVAPIIDYPDGRGNTPWGLGNVVAGPLSGYAWEFDYGTFTNTAGTTAQKIQAAIKIGPWQRIRYPGSQISVDQPGLASTALGYAAIDASNMGYDLTPASPLPTDTKTVRFAIGQLELGRPEFSAVKVKVLNKPCETCAKMYGDAFGGDAGGTDSGKDHIWRYFDPTVVSLSPCTFLQKTVSKSLVAPGETFFYTLVFANNGTIALPNITLTDALPSGITYLSATPPPTSMASPTYTWNLGTIEPNTMVVITNWVKATSAGTFFNNVTARSGTEIIASANQSVEVATRSVLQKVKTVEPSSVAAGDTVEYSITVSNLGTGGNGVPLVVRDFLPAGFTFDSFVGATLNGASVASPTIIVNASDPSVTTFTVAQSIQPGKELVIRFKAVVGDAVQPGSYFNNVELLYEGKRQPPIPEASVTVAGGKIGDTVYRDWDGDGMQDAGEEGLAGVTMQLFAADGTTLLQTVVTDANGHYMFNGLIDATYVVKVASGVPSAYALTDDPDASLDAQHTVTLGVDESYIIADFGYQPAGSGAIGDTIFADDNKSGTLDGGEAGITNVTVYLYEDTNGNGLRDSGDVLVATDTTDSLGNYLFTNLAEGLSYLVYVNPADAALSAYFDPYSYQVTTPNAYPVPNLSGNYMGADIGWFGLEPASIGDLVFLDANGDGDYDAGTDSPLANVTVNLYQDNVLVASAVTSTDGTYLFEGLAPGTYVVRTDSASSGIPVGYAAAAGPFTVVLDAGDSYLNADFPFVPLISKSVDKTYARPGTNLTFGINVDYTGNRMLSDVTVKDYVPAGTTFNSVGQGGALQTFASAPGVPGIDAGSGGSATVTVTNQADVIDTWLDENSPTVNYGATADIRVDSESGRPERTVVRFALPPSLPNDAVVTSASLTLTKLSGNTIDISAHQAANEWNEAQATWNNRLTATAWDAAGGDYDQALADPVVSSGAATGARTWSVPHIVQSWIEGAANYGFLLKHPLEDPGNKANLFASSEHATVASRPSLTFSYTSTARPVTTNTLSLSAPVTAVGVPVTVTMTVVSSWSLANVAPTALQVVGGAASVSGPVPASQSLTANVPATFTWTVTPSEIKEYTFSAGASNVSYTFVVATSPSLLASPEGQDTYVVWNLGSNVDGRSGLTAQKKYLYAFQGADTLNFWGYNTATATWNSPDDPANTPAGVTVKEGGALTTDGSRFIYALRGDATRVFLRYDAASNTWDDAVVADLPVTTDKVVLKGGAVTYLNGYVYALIGNDSLQFWRYSVALNTWSQMANALGTVNNGARLTTDGVSIYATQGDGRKGFWRYNVGANTWTAMTAFAENIGDGGGLVYAEGAIYVIRGDGKPTFRRYNISANTWTTLAPVPANVDDGGAIAFDGTDIYVLRGKSTTFYRYSIAADSWTALSAAPGTIGWGGSLTFLASGNVTRTFAEAEPTLVSGVTAVTLRMRVTSDTLVANIAANAPTWTVTSGVSASITAGPVLVSANDDLDGTSTDEVVYEWTVQVTAGAVPGSITFTTSNSAGGSATANSVLVTPTLTYTATVGNNPPDVIRNTAYVHEDSDVFEETPSNTTETYTSATIGDRVWHDADGDGVQDADEVGLAGVRVEVYASDGVTLLGSDVTDATGAYRVSGLAAGDYIVRIVPETYPAGYEPSTAGELSVTVSAGQQYDAADFGLLPAPVGTGSIGNSLWLDADGDGLQDEGESPLAGVDVILERLVGGVWTTLATETTGTNGLYAFTALVDGEYRVTVDTNSLVASPFGGSYPLGAATLPTYDLNGTNTPHHVTVTLNETQRVYDTVDFGYNWSGAIGDYVWWDDDFDGVAESGEQPLTNAFVMVYFDFNGNGILDPTMGDYQIAATRTDANGYYLIDNLPPGPYLVDVYEDSITTSGVRNIVPTTSDVIYHQLGAGETFDGADFGYYVGAAVAGNVFWDDNRNAFYEMYELGLTNVTVTLTGTDMNGDPVSRTTTTDADGQFYFVIPEGDYTVSYNVPSLLATYPALGDATTPNSITFHAYPGEEQTTVLDFGVDSSGRIGDTVFADTNGTVGQQAGEAGLEGVSVLLYVNPDNSTALNGDETLLEVMATDALGQYLFFGLGDGNYLVQVATNTIPAEYQSTPTTDPNGAMDSQGTATVSSGATVLTMDFGYPLTPLSYSVSGTLYDDNGAGGGTAGNGVQDGAELGIANVRVTVEIDTDGNGTYDQTLTVFTDANGYYEALGIPEASDVRITVDTSTLPSTAYVQTGDPNGGTLSNVWTIDNLQADTANLDFGYRAQYGSISGVVADGDGDGVAEPGEPTLASVTVTLLYAGTDGIFGTNDDTATNKVSGVDGGYSFTGLVPGNYRVIESDPVGYVSLADADGGNPNIIDVAGLQAGQSVTGRDFEDTRTDLAIGDRIWLDEDGDGVQDAGEDGIANVLVSLYGAGDDGIPGSPDDVLLAQTTSDAEGGYVFIGLAPGSYVVEVDANSMPAGLSANPTYDLDGTGTPHAAVVSIASGEGNFEADFGYNWAAAADVTANAGTGAIGDRVWIDADGDGTQDPNEIGLTNLVVRLYADGDGDGLYTDLVAETVTGTDGRYVFDGLSAGTYVVEVNGGAAPAGYAATGDPDTLGGLVTPPDNRTTVPVILAPGDVYVNADFGYDPTAGSTIGDRVYFDANADGMYAAGDGDSGVAGVSVSLLDAGGNVIGTTVTDADGVYRFDGLPAGTYTVWVNDTRNVLGGLQQTGDPDVTLDSAHTLAVDGVGSYLDNDFGYTAPGHNPGEGLIGDLIFLDRNGNGLAENEEGVEGVAVRLFASDGTTLLAVTTTDENGHYWFGGLGTSDVTYVVRVDTNSLPGASGQLSNTVDPDGGTGSEATVTLTAANPVSLVQDFGYADLSVPNAITGTIWNDANSDGNLSGETGVYAGVTVALVDADGDIVATTVTDAFGNYTFSGLPDGTYTVDVTDTGNILAGLWHSIGSANLDNNSQSDPYTVSVSGGNTYPADFGYYGQPAAVGNRVWDDLNANGIQDLGEPGLSNVLVRLTLAYPDGTTNIVVTLTDTNGVYSFGNLLLDEQYDGVGGSEPVYVVSVSAPTNYLAAPVDQGGDDGQDADLAAGVIAEVARGGLSDSYDFGVYLTAAIKGHVFRDVDADMYRDTGDRNLTNALVRLVVDGVVIASTNTDANGYYQFDNVPVGTVSVLVSRVDATLSGVPESSDESRNRALPDTEGVDAVIVFTVTSGYGVLADRPAETLNFGFVTYPLSMAIDISLYATSDGVMIEIWTVNESGYEDIEIYAWINNAWFEVGRVPSWQIVGEGSNRYTVQATGLAVGLSYNIKIVDETGHVHVSSTPVAVRSLRVEAVRLDMQTLAVSFNTEQGRRYVVQVSTDLVNWTTEYVSYPTANGWSAFTDEAFTAGGARTEVRVPVNGRAKAFFKVVMAE